MAKFDIGNRVLALDTGSKGIIIEVCPPRRGRQLYNVSFRDGEKYVLESELKPDCDIADPFERCKIGIYDSYSDFSRKNTTFKISNSNNSTISSLKASKTLFRAYQFKPLLKFLNSPNRRLLIADEVGLGKTIEAGHIMLELQARNELRNVLIVCPKTLQEKWKAELNEKFGFSFKIYDRVIDLVQDLNDNNGNIRAIINYEKIRAKNKKGTGSSVADEELTKKNLVEFLNQSDKRFSMVLCDEAHKMRNSNTQTYTGAEIIMDHAQSAVFLTATPIMISRENLYNLLHLLDKTKYFNYEIFENRMQENEPFVAAITSLNKDMSLIDIRDELVSTEITTSFSLNDGTVFSDTATIGNIFHDDPVFKEIYELLSGNDTIKSRVRLQYLLSTMSAMNTVFSRTRKRDVTTDLSQAERKPHLCKIDLEENEQIIYDEIIQTYVNDNSYTDDWGEERMSQGISLGLVQKKRQVASSVYAYKNSDSDLDKGIDRYETYEDSKFNKLLEVLNEVKSKGRKKLIVFALFRKTLRYLEIRLKKRGIKCLVIHGLISDRANVLSRFEKDPTIEILLSSEVGSEGLDMQFCDSMVNYDLPWNPMVIEQRIGRIDRFGQQSEVVNIYNFVVAGSIQEVIYMRLLDRIGIFKRTIGDMEAILDAEVSDNFTIQDLYSKMEKEFFTERLSKEEIEKKILEVERAIENEKQNLERLQEDLSNTLTNDAYFKDEINKILNNMAYVTEIELRNYIQSVIRQKLTTCNLVDVGGGIWEMRMSLSDPCALRNFVTTYSSLGRENEITLYKFKNEIDGKTKIRFTFNQDVAYADRSISYINLYHPIIQACLNYYIEKDNGDDSQMSSFCFAIKQEDRLKLGNTYYIALYQLSITRRIQLMQKTSAEIYPIVFSVQDDCIVDDQDTIDTIFRKMQTQGVERNLSNDDINPDLIDDIKVEFTVRINNEKKRRITEISNQLESDRLRNVHQTKEYYASRIKNDEQRLEDLRLKLLSSYDDADKKKITNIIRLTKSRIESTERDRDAILLKLNEDPELSIKEKLLSVNLIKII